LIASGATDSVRAMMGRLRVFASLFCVLMSAVALADPNDFQISKLGNPFETGDPAHPSNGYLVEANGNFRIFARRFAAAMTSVNLSPPETLGHSAFAFSAELSVVDFGDPRAPTAGGLPTESSDPARRETDFAGPMLIPSIHVRKGLPFSFEVGARGAWIEKSRMGAGTLELKWALNEGFAYLPDIAVRGNITKLLNTRDFDITAGGLDLGIGKQFALGGMVTLTPYVGWNLLFVGASTGNVDFRPNRTLAESDKPNEQFRDMSVFASLSAISNSHNRFYGGLRFIGGVLMIGAEFSYSVISDFKDDDLTRAKGARVDRSVAPVRAWNFTLGLDF
jgi:hypothetical protein